jgi:hypothetical protein
VTGRARSADRLDVALRDNPIVGVGAVHIKEYGTDGCCGGAWLEAHDPGFYRGSMDAPEPG